MPGLSDLAAEALDNPTPRMLRVIEAAEEQGWTVGVITTCVRLSKPDDKPGRAGGVALPFYATWRLNGWTAKGKPSWTFMGAAASNLQPLSESDIPVYLADPSVIHPDFEADRKLGGCESAGCPRPPREWRGGQFCDDHAKRFMLPADFSAGPTEKKETTCP